MLHDVLYGHIYGDLNPFPLGKGIDGSEGQVPYVINHSVFSCNYSVSGWSFHSLAGCYNQSIDLFSNYRSVIWSFV